MTNQPFNSAPVSGAPTNLLLVARALKFSSLKHRDQRRLDAPASPYINHPIELLNVLVECGIEDTATLMAALLHDTVEDTQTTLEELSELFGPEVCRLVAQVSDDMGLAKEERKRLQVVRAGSIHYKARLIKLADKTANLNDIAASPPLSWSLTRRQKYFDWAKEVIDALGPDMPEPLVTRFRLAYARRPLV